MMTSGEHGISQRMSNWRWIGSRNNVIISEVNSCVSITCTVDALDLSFIFRGNKKERGRERVTTKKRLQSTYNIIHLCCIYVHNRHAIINFSILVQRFKPHSHWIQIGFELQRIFNETKFDRPRSRSHCDTERG